MNKYLLKRILLIAPTLLAIALFSFLLLVHSPGDPAERILTSNYNRSEIIGSGYSEKTLKQIRHQLGLNLPTFYFSIHSLGEPKTYAGTDLTKDQLTAWKQLNYATGNPEKSFQYIHNVTRLQSAIPDQKIGNDSELSELVHRLSTEYDSTRIINLFSKAKQLSESTYHINEVIASTENDFLQLYAEKKSWKNFIPVISFHYPNRFHNWLFGDNSESRGIIRADFGKSYLTGERVTDYLISRTGWSLFFTLTSVVLALLISIPLAKKMYLKRKKPFDNLISALLFLLYSLPGFWMATLLLMFFANPDILPMFPASGVSPVGGFNAGIGFTEKIIRTMPYLVLPTFCYLYSGVVFQTRLLRNNMIEESRKGYVRTAFSKGLKEKDVLRYHILRNSLLPLAVLLSNIFPALLGGSVIIETIFSIPGLGSAIYQSIDNQDIPVMLAVFSITGLLTVIGYLMGDITYSYIDPRIRYERTN